MTNEELDDPMMSLRTIRLVLIFVSFLFFFDGLMHRYVWPGEMLQPSRTERMVRVLFTHSREGTDTWGMLLCWLIASGIWQREQDIENLR
jgi:hypothetical protein